MKKSDTLHFLESISGGELTFGRLLYSIRMGDEISQVDFAKKLGISKTQLCDIEKDRRAVTQLDMDDVPGEFARPHVRRRRLL